MKRAGDEGRVSLFYFFSYFLLFTLFYAATEKQLRQMSRSSCIFYQFKIYGHNCELTGVMGMELIFTIIAPNNMRCTD